MPDTPIPEGNKSRVSGDGLESNRPATNFQRISVDSNRFDCLAEKSGLGVGLRPLQSPNSLWINRGTFLYLELVGIVVVI